MSKPNQPAFGAMRLEQFLELDEDGLVAFIEDRLRRLQRTATDSQEEGIELPFVAKGRRELIEYGNELGPYAYQLDSIEGLRLLALAAELECLDVRDELRAIRQAAEEIHSLPELPEEDERPASDPD